MTLPSSTLAGQDLQKITAWHCDKDGNIIPIPIPGSDSDENEAIDVLGVSETITIIGQWTGDFDSRQTKIQAIKNIINGNQDTSSTLSSPYCVTGSSKGTSSVALERDVKVSKLSYSWEIPGLTKVDYEITCIIGGD